MISIEKENPNYFSCYDCIHTHDMTETCILRGCIHAIRELKECYEPVKQRKPKKPMKEGDKH